VLIRVTLAFGTTAPCGSTTVPAIEPVVICALAGTTANKNPTAKAILFTGISEPPD
jgi:hypothetical protein